MKDLSVLEHGFSVARYFKDIYDHLKYNKPLTKEWKLPEWIYNPIILEKLINIKTLYTYQIYHDCGKPYCIYFDENNNRHFPNHAEISYQVWKNISLNNDVAELIRNDMEVHLMKMEEVEDFSKSKYAISLLLTGLAEIHSNAEMFGGIDSVSFKIKWKKINKVGKNLLQYY